MFSSTAREFRTELLLSRDITSRTYSLYYPRCRPQGHPRYLIVSSTNAHYSDWADLTEDEYEESKRDLIETTLDAVDKYVPNIRERLAHVEAATPKTFQHYTQHVAGGRIIEETGSMMSLWSSLTCDTARDGRSHALNAHALNAHALNEHVQNVHVISWCALNACALRL